MTVFIKKLLLILTVFLTISICAFSQMNLEQLINIKLGETFADSKQTIKSMFTQKGQIMKADFFGAYRIEYEKMPLNYYGNAYYTFQYAKDTLVSVKIEFSFKASDTVEFRRLFNTLINDLKSDNSKRILKQYNDLNAQKIFPYVTANCITNTQREDKNYKHIQAILPMEHEERDKKYFEDEMNSKLETFIDRINTEGGYIKVLTSNNERLFHKWKIEGISNQLRRAIGLD